MLDCCNITVVILSTAATHMVNVQPCSCSGMCISSCHDAREVISIKTEEGKDAEVKVEEIPRAYILP